YTVSLYPAQASYLALYAMYELCTFFTSGSLATASASTLFVVSRKALTTGSGSARAMTFWFLTRSSIASALVRWHQASLITLHAAAAFSTTACRSFGSFSQAALLISSSDTV